MRSSSNQRIIILTCFGLCAAAESAEFTPLGNFPDSEVTDSYATSISSDGQIVVGQAGATAFRWSAKTGLVRLDNDLGFDGAYRAFQISEDGNVIVGDTLNDDIFRWSASNGTEIIIIGSFDMGVIGVTDVSADGQVVVGNFIVNFHGAEEAFRWTPGTGLVHLGRPDDPFGSSFAYAVTDDGGLIVGEEEENTEGLNWSAFDWTPGTGKVDGRGGRVLSADGSTRVSGLSRWTKKTGWTRMGESSEIGPADSHKQCDSSGASANGRVVVGWCSTPWSEEATIWTETGGLQRLAVVLAANGASEAVGWQLRRATDVSSDGLFVSGSGTNPDGIQEAFRANVSGLRSLDTLREIDIAELGDVSGDGIADFASLLVNTGGRPLVRIFSGVDGADISTVWFLTQDWQGIAAVELPRWNSESGEEGAIAVLGKNHNDGRVIIQVRDPVTKSRLRNIEFLGKHWNPLDVVVIDDPNGDGIVDDSAIGVLGYNSSRSHQQRILLQVRRASDGQLLRNVFFANADWTPLAAGVIERDGQAPLLAVLAETEISSRKKVIVQTRYLADGSLHREKIYLSVKWRAKDLAILKDTNGDGIATDPSLMVLATETTDGGNRVQVRRPGGAFVKNIDLPNPEWTASRITSTEDITGNRFEEVAILRKSITNDMALIELRDFATEQVTSQASP